MEQEILAGRWIHEILNRIPNIDPNYPIEFHAGKGKRVHKTTDGAYDECGHDITITMRDYRSSNLKDIPPRRLGIQLKSSSYVNWTSFGANIRSIILGNYADIIYTPDYIPRHFSDLALLGYVDALGSSKMSPYVLVYWPYLIATINRNPALIEKNTNSKHDHSFAYINIDKLVKIPHAIVKDREGILIMDFSKFWL